MFQSLKRTFIKRAKDSGNDDDLTKSVFISYRRADVMTARAVYENLTKNGYDCFLDSESIGSGSFKSIICEQIKGRSHFILILTKTALKRCMEPGDFLRLEIETALTHQRNVVPLLFDGFDFQSNNNHMTGDLLPILPTYNGVPIPADYFEEAMTRLRERFLCRLPNEMSHPTLTQHFHDIEDDENDTEEKETKQEAQRVTTDLSPGSSTVHENQKAKTAAKRYFQLGLKQDNQNEKVALFSKAINLRPDYPEALCNRGNAYRRLGHNEKAMSDLSEAIKVKPNYSVAYYNRGIVHSRLGRLEAAVADYSEAIRNNPQYSKAFNNRAFTLHRLGTRENFIQALDDANTALSIEPDHVNFIHTRGTVFFDLGRYDESLVDFERALKLRPGDSLYEHDLARARTAKQKDIAVEDVDVEETANCFELNFLKEKTKIESPKKEEPDLKKSKNINLAAGNGVDGENTSCFELNFLEENIRKPKHQQAEMATNLYTDLTAADTTVTKHMNCFELNFLEEETRRVKQQEVESAKRSDTVLPDENGNVRENMECFESNFLK